MNNSYFGKLTYTRFHALYCSVLAFLMLGQRLGLNFDPFPWLKFTYFILPFRLKQHLKSRSTIT